jgi:hypothetical protein
MTATRATANSSGRLCSEMAVLSSPASAVRRTLVAVRPERVAVKAIWSAICSARRNGSCTVGSAMSSSPLFASCLEDYCSLHPGPIPRAHLTGVPPEPFVSPELPPGYCLADMSPGFDTRLPSPQPSASEAELNCPLGMVTRFPKDALGALCLFRLRSSVWQGLRIPGGSIP